MNPPLEVSQNIIRLLHELDQYTAFHPRKIEISCIIFETIASYPMFLEHSHLRSVMSRKITEIHTFLDESRESPLYHIIEPYVFRLNVQSTNVQNIIEEKKQQLERLMNQELVG